MGTNVLSFALFIFGECLLESPTSALAVSEFIFCNRFVCAISKSVVLVAELPEVVKLNLGVFISIFWFSEADVSLHFGDLLMRVLVLLVLDLLVLDKFDSLIESEVLSPRLLKIVELSLGAGILLFCFSDVDCSLQSGDVSISVLVLLLLDFLVLDKADWVMAAVLLKAGRELWLLGDFFGWITKVFSGDLSTWTSSFVLDLLFFFTSSSWVSGVGASGTSCLSNSAGFKILVLKLSFVLTVVSSLDVFVISFDGEVSVLSLFKISEAERLKFSLKTL